MPLNIAKTPYVSSTFSEKPSVDHATHGILTNREVESHLQYLTNDYNVKCQLFLKCSHVKPSQKCLVYIGIYLVQFIFCLSFFQFFPHSYLLW